jgi:hypothetical protein
MNSQIAAKLISHLETLGFTTSTPADAQDLEKVLERHPEMRDVFSFLTVGLDQRHIVTLEEMEAAAKVEKETGQTLEKLRAEQREAEISRAFGLERDIEKEVYNLETELLLMDREI